MILGGTPGDQVISSNNTIAPWYHTAATGLDTATSAPLVAGTLTNFKLVLSAAGTWRVDLLKNSALIVPPASCLITAGTSCTIAGPITFADGDRFGVHMSVIGPVAPTRVAFKVDYAITP